VSREGPFSWYSPGGSESRSQVCRNQARASPTTIHLALIIFSYKVSSGFHGAKGREPGRRDLYPSRRYARPRSASPFVTRHSVSCDTLPAGSDAAARCIGSCVPISRIILRSVVTLVTLEPGTTTLRQGSGSHPRDTDFTANAAPSQLPRYGPLGRFTQFHSARRAIERGMARYWGSYDVPKRVRMATLGSPRSHSRNRSERSIWNLGYHLPRSSLCEQLPVPSSGRCSCILVLLFGTAFGAPTLTDCRHPGPVPLPGQGDGARADKPAGIRITHASRES
jgi:hypothetical protein